MNTKFITEKDGGLWKVVHMEDQIINGENIPLKKEWWFESLEDVGVFMEDYFDKLDERNKSSELLNNALKWCYNNDSTIN